MPSTFSRTLRSLEADSFRRSFWALVVVVGLLGAGGAWFFLAEVAVYETTEGARLEVAKAAHPVAASVAGRVNATHLVLGGKVREGEVLVELEDETERLQLEEEKSRLATFRGRREALRGQLTAEEGAWPEEKKSATLAVEEARAHVDEVEASAKFAAGEAERARRLNQNGVLSQAERQRAETEAQKQRAVASAQAFTVARFEADLKLKERNREVRWAQLQRDGAMLDGDISTSEATVKRNAFSLERRRIRAPVTGELGEIAELRAGGFVAEGQKLGAVIPAGELKLVAQFPPLTAAGRLRPGQPARLRLAAYPWAQYGSVAATVSGVAQEPLDGQLRVEFRVQPESVPGVALQHGLVGSVEVQVDRRSPATLVLRAAGKLLAVPHGAGTPAAAARGKL